MDTVARFSIFTLTQPVLLCGTFLLLYLPSFGAVFLRSINGSSKSGAMLVAVGAIEAAWVGWLQYDPDPGATQKPATGF